VFVWNYHEMDVDEVREQLLDCPDAALKEVVYRALGSDVVTITQADLLKVIEILAVVEVEETVYDALGSEVDTLSPDRLDLADRGARRGGGRRGHEADGGASG
jgi:hypothetical protein